VRPARSREELHSAYSRVYWSYRRRAYIEAEASQMQVTVFNAFPQTVTFVSLYRHKVTASITLIPDTAIGLPMDENWQPHLDELREQGRYPAEATMFADRRHRDFRRVIPMLLLLMKRLFDYAALVEGVDDICINVSPRHRGFYERFLPFRRFCPERNIAGDRDERGVAMRLAIDDLDADSIDDEDLRKHFLEDRTPRRELENRYRLDCSDLRHFFVDCTDTLRRADERCWQALRRHYPGCPWDRWQEEVKKGSGG